MNKLIKRYNILVTKYPSSDNSKAKKVKARIKHKIITKAREVNISLYIDTYNIIYTEQEYQQIKSEYKSKQSLSCFKMKKIC